MREETKEGVERRKEGSGMEDTMRTAMSEYLTVTDPLALRSSRLLTLNVHFTNRLLERGRN